MTLNCILPRASDVARRRKNLHLHVISPLCKQGLSPIHLKKKGFFIEKRIGMGHAWFSDS